MSEMVPVRFRSFDDAILYMNCVRNKSKFPKSKWIYPFIEVGGLAVENPEYRDAPYEQSFRFFGEKILI